MAHFNSHFLRKTRSTNTNDSAEPPCPHLAIAAESPTLLVTMECRNACKESATSTVITFESQRNIVTQWETQWNTQWNRQWNTPWNAVIYSVSCSWAEQRLSAFQRILIFAFLPGTKRCKLQRFVVCFTVCAQLGATGPPCQQTWHKKRIPRQAKSTTASMVPGAFQHAEPIKHTNSTSALQEIGCKSNPNMGAETLRKSVQDLRPFMGLRIMNYTKRSAIAKAPMKNIPSMRSPVEDFRSWSFQ